MPKLVTLIATETFDFWVPDDWTDEIIMRQFSTLIDPEFQRDADLVQSEASLEIIWKGDDEMYWHDLNDS